MSLDVRPILTETPRLDPGLVADAAIVMCDLDGCLVSEGSAFEDAAAFVRSCGSRIWIVSNNSTDTADGLSAQLRALDLEIPADRIVLAGEQTLELLKQVAPNEPLSLFASSALIARASDLGLTLVDDGPSRAVLCRDPSFSIPKLNRIARQLDDGAALWVSNTDLTHPGREGRPVAETGALLAAVQAVAGEVTYHSIGKPDPHMARLVLGDVNPRKAVFVGDNLTTDGGVAAALGMPFVHLRREGVA